MKVVEVHRHAWQIDPALLSDELARRAFIHTVRKRNHVTGRIKIQRHTNAVRLMQGLPPHIYTITFYCHTDHEEKP